MGPVDIRAIRDAHNRFLRKQQNEIDYAAREGGEFGARYAGGHKFKKPTGALEGATKVRVIRTSSGNRLILSNSKKYALAQEYGSGLHATRGPRAKYAIMPRRAKALRFVINGKVIYSRKVMHPGVPATRWLFQKTEAAGAHEWNQLKRRLGRLAENF
jgi:hypothetical protein